MQQKHDLQLNSGAYKTREERRCTKWPKSCAKCQESRCSTTKANLFNNNNKRHSATIAAATSKQTKQTNDERTSADLTLSVAWCGTSYPGVAVMGCSGPPNRVQAVKGA